MTPDLGAFSVDRACICSYTWGPDGKPVRNGPMVSCRALHPEDVTVTVDGGGPIPGEWGQVQYVPGLEERVAALEALLLPREPEWTPEQAEEFRAEFEQRAAAGGFDDGHLHDLVYPVRPAQAGDPHADQRRGRAYGFHSASR